MKNNIKHIFTSFQMNKAKTDAPSVYMPHEFKDHEPFTPLQRTPRC